MKIYTNELSHITNMATLPIYGENLKKSSPEPLDWKCLHLACIFRWAIQGLRALLSDEDFSGSNAPTILKPFSNVVRSIVLWEMK